MKYIKITCPCKRPHNKRYDDQVSYVEEECKKLMGFIGEDSEEAYFAYHCSDCKKVIEGSFKDGKVSLTISKDRIQEINNPVVITYE